ncbi:3-oxoacyl-[acyl-carrier protein] reductase [Variovorax sp. HW608]|uniref:SDR family NAD(P)-dependent oxidoreductase n=1 Tax=Variovorax sp. HW608 TaxID=1034889 RepID=UPI00081FF903|nr:SDR family oxidoreductase [Variovorax sp. HW608]SCK29103.1 3-oxoacyl-[acyl-carrier protein] reductase [Variovorax sp. HW608]
MTPRFEGKVALITGGARGIGRGIVEAIAAEGGIVGILDRAEDLAREAAAAVEAAGGRAMAFGGDVTHRETFANAIAAMKERHGRFDILVNNAIWVRYGPIAEITPEMLDRMVGTGFNSVVWGIQTAAEAMARGGSIVNIASAAAFIGMPHGMIYSGVKSGVLGLSRSAAVELGPRGIRVNSVCPGSVPTEGVRLNVDAEKVKLRIAKTPMQRLSSVQDVADAACFLASDAARSITGESLLVDGGATHAFL